MGPHRRVRLGGREEGLNSPVPADCHKLPDGSLLHSLPATSRTPPKPPEDVEDGEDCSRRLHFLPSSQLSPDLPYLHSKPSSRTTPVVDSELRTLDLRFRLCSSPSPSPAPFRLRADGSVPSASCRRPHANGVQFSAPPKLPQVMEGKDGRGSPAPKLLELVEDRDERGGMKLRGSVPVRPPLSPRSRLARSRSQATPAKDSQVGRLHLLGFMNQLHPPLGSMQRADDCMPALIHASDSRRPPASSKLSCRRPLDSPCASAYDEFMTQGLRGPRFQ